MFKAEGLITPVVTALTEKEEFNKKEYQAFIDHLIKAGVHGIFPLGTNGEFYAFSFKEKLEIIEAAVEAVHPPDGKRQRTADKRNDRNVEGGSTDGRYRLPVHHYSVLCKSFSG